MEKLIIAGAGPAGVSAALYATRLGITPLVIHNGAGALEKAVKIENYYGLPEVIYMEPLCQILGITVNELLAGETIPILELLSNRQQKICCKISK